MVEALLDSPGKGHPWKPHFESASSLEHRTCLNIAYLISNEIASRFPERIENLKHLPAFDTLWAEKAIIPVERSAETIDIGSISGFDYVMRVVRQDRLGQSRVLKPTDPGMLSVVPVGELEIRLEPKSEADSVRQPIYEAIITLSKYGDEKSLRPLEVMGVVPMVQRNTVIGTEAVGLSLTARGDRHIPKHPLSLEEIAASSNPELGPYALHALQEVLDAGLHAIQNRDTKAIDYSVLS